MVETLQATQAREGIETTREQAERAYRVVTERERAAFFDLERFRGQKDKFDRRHEMFVRSLRGETEDIRFDVPLADFSTIEESPLSYRRVETVGHIFRESPPLEPAFASVTSGLMTVQSERIMRWHWEIPESSRAFLKGWSRFAKGGEFSRFYRDVDLLVDMGPRTLPLLEQEGSLRNRALYGREGLTWVPRTQRGFNVQHLPSGAVFGKKGPIILPKNPVDQWWLLSVLNSHMAEYLLQGLMSFGSYEVGVLQRLPIAMPQRAHAERFTEIAKTIHDAKAAWDEGNETSTRFREPWLLRDEIVGAASLLSVRLDRAVEYETREEGHIRELYSELNDNVYRLYGIPDRIRSTIDKTLGERPPEVLWAQMEGRSSDQKRMEHVFRLLSFVVKRVIAADDDGVVAFTPLAGEPALIDRVRQELQTVFPEQDIGRLEVEITNELKKNVNGYRRTNGIAEWLENAFFEYHASLYQDRPIIWHIASSQGAARCAFGALVDYHRFDRERMAKLRARYLREAIDTFRREAAVAGKEERTDERLEWQARLEEGEEVGRRLQRIEEGYHEGSDGGENDFRIAAPWRPSHSRPKGWQPDLDDGVRVNIEPLQKARVLRVVKVV